MSQPDFHTKLTWLIIIMTLIRGICASLVELGNDEVYYYTYAVQPDWNHFDHPPLVGIVIRFFTLNLHWVNDFSMRLGAIVGAGLSTWLIAYIGQSIKNERTGFIAAILYNACIYTGIIAGLFILPDSPMTVFWLAATYSVIKALSTDNRQLQSTYMVWAGIWVGLAMMSKLNGGFLWFGILGYALFCKRDMFRVPGLYLGLMMTGILVLPILLWNIEHNFITWKFHGERIDVSGHLFDIQNFIKATIGQILYHNPFITILTVAALWSWFRGMVYLDEKIAHFLFWIAFPIILVTSLLSLFRPVLPHWSGPGLIPLMLLTAAWADERMTLQNNFSRERMLINLILYFNLFIMLLGVMLIKWYPGTTGSKDPDQYGKGDFTLEMSGWDSFSGEFSEIQKKEKLPLIIDNWFPGGHIYYYVARPFQLSIVPYGSLYDIHKFAWITSSENCILPGEDAYYISLSNFYTNPVKRYGMDFEKITLIHQIPEMRGGKLSRYWSVYRLEKAKNKIGPSVITK